MKKNLFLILCLALGITALTSCQDQEKSTGIRSEREPMFFTTGIDNTRRPIASTSIDEIKYFWLVVTTLNETSGNRDTLYCGRALHHEGEVTLYNEDYLEDDGSLLWPEDKDQRVNIYAIQERDNTSPDDPDPMTISIGSYTGSIPNYFPLSLYPYDETPQETDDQLTAHVITSRNETSGGVIALNFKHILSQVQVSVKVADDGYFYRISNLRITGFIHGAYQFSDNSESQDGWITNTQFLESACNHLASQGYSAATLQADASEDEAWQPISEPHYLYYADWEDDYLDIGAYNGDNYVTLMGTDLNDEPAPLSTFLLPLYTYNNLSIEYSVWTKATNPEDGSIVAGEKVEDFEYTTSLSLQPGQLINLQLHFKALSIEFAGDNEEGMEPD